MAVPKPKPTPVVGSIADMIKKPAKVTSGKTKTPAATKPAKTTAVVGSIADMVSGKSSAPAKPKAIGLDAEFQKGLTNTISAGQIALNTAFTPGNFIEDLAYRLATPTTISERRRMDQSIAKNGYFGWLGSEYATSWKNATAWQRGEEVKHTGGAIAKRLGLISPKKDFWSQAQNFLVGTAFDIALDPFTHTPALPVFALVKGASRAGTAVLKSVGESASGKVLASTAKKRLSEEALKEAQITTKITPKTGIKPKNLVPIDQAGLGKEMQDLYLSKLTKANTKLVKLPGTVGIDRTMSQKAADGVATALGSGYNAFRQVMLSHEANKFLDKWARQSARVTNKTTADYLHNTAENATAKTEVPKPSEIKIESPAIATKSEVAFPERAPDPFTSGMASAGAKDIKEVKSALSYMDNIAKRVVGTKATSGVVSESVFNFMRNVDSNSNKIFNALKPELQTAVNDAINRNAFNPKELFKDFLARAKNGDKAATAFVSSFGNRVIAFDSGRDTIGNFFNKNADIPFDKLSKPDKIAITKQLASFTSDTSASAVAELNRLTNNTDIAKKLIAAGALTPAGRAKNKEAINSLLADLAKSSSTSQKVRYGSVEDIVAGLRAGDVISGESLAKIIKKLDPQNAVIAQIEKAGTKPSFEMMAEILKGDGSVNQTLAQMRERLTLANTETFLSASGVSLPKTVAAVLDAHLLGTLELPPEVHIASREYAAKAVARMEQKTIDDATNILQDSFAQRFGEAADILTKQGAHERISDLGDHAILGATAPYKGGEVILADQTGTSFSALVSLKALGRGTYGVGKKVKKMTEAELETFKTSTEKMNRFIARMFSVDETLLATTGSRLFVQKTRAEVGADLAKMHRSYIHLGDIAMLFRDVSAETKDVIERSLFPVGVNNTKFDGFATISVLNVARQVLEDRELKNPHNIADLIQMLIRHEGKNKPSEAFITEQAALAPKFIQHLVTDIAPDLEKIHLNRATAAVLDHASRSMDINTQIIGRLKEAWKTATETGWATPEERFAHIKDMFMRFAYNADIVRQTDGAVAEAVMRAASMIMLKGGKLSVHDGEPLSDVYKLFPQKGSEDYQQMWEIINTYARKDDPMLAAPVGREMLPKPKPEAVAKASAKMREVMDAVEAHIAKGQTLTNKQELRSWRTQGNVLAKSLETARRGAWYAWLPITHYSNKLSRWVPADQYDHAAELVWAKQHPPVLIGDELVKISEEIVDSVPKAAEVANSGAKVAASRAAKNEAAKTRQLDLAGALAEDAAQKVLDRAAEFDALGLDPVETALRMNDEAAFLQFDSAQPKIQMPDVFEASMKQGESKLKTFNERWSQFGQRADTSGYLQNAQSLVHTYRSDLARAMHKISSAFKGISQEDFALVWNDVVEHNPINAELPADLQNFHRVLASVIDPLMKDAEINSIDSEALKNVLSMYGLTDKNGFGTKGSISEMLKMIPFGKNPYKPGTNDFEMWVTRRNEFLNAGLDPLMAIVRLGSAIQHVKSVQTLAANLVENTGWKVYFKTYEEAVQAGFVRVASKLGSDSEILNALVKPEEGALFHPNIAPQIAAVAREWSRLSEKQNYAKAISAIMDLTGYLKFAQTSINPRHHFTNLFGEMSAELLRMNLNVVTWKQAIDISLEFGKQVFKSDYSKDPMYDAISRTIAHMDVTDEAARELVRYTKNGAKAIDVKFVNKDRTFSNVDLAMKLSQRNIATSGIFSDEVTGLFEHLMLDNSSGSRRQLNNSMKLRLQTGMEKVMKPIGDATAVYTNVPRIAGAIRVMQSRVWKSEEEMWNAVAQDVHLYHPSIASLASGERKYGRLFIGYYTWLRVAHSAFIDMAMNHTAGITFVPKLMNNIREQQGLASAGSGTPWDPNQTYPQNMRGMVYGPLYKTPNGPQGIQTSTLPMDVMNQWQWYSDGLLNQRDPNYVEGKNWETTWRYLLGSSNPIIKQVAQEISGMNFQTGVTFKDRSIPAILDRAAQIIGPYQALKGAGLVTPLGKEKTTTPAKRDQALFNWITGVKQFDAQDPGAVKVGKIEDSKRIKAWFDAVAKNGGK